jgi:prevent-host-death family protein
MVNMHEAKSKLSALVKAVEAGEADEIVLTRNGKPAARIVPLDRTAGRVIFGLMKGRFVTPGDEVWAEMDEEIAASFTGDDDLSNAAG